MADLKPVELDKYGLAKVSDYRYVNPKYATPESAYKMLQIANPQVSAKELQALTGFEGYRRGYQSDSGQTYSYKPKYDEFGVAIPGSQGDFYTPQEIASKFGSGGYIPNLPTTISSEILAGSPVSTNLPTLSTPSSDTANAITASASANITQSKEQTDRDEIARMEKDRLAQAQVKEKETKSGLWEAITGKKKVLEETATAKQAPEFLAKKQATEDAYNTLVKSKQAEANEKDAVMKQSMLTDVQKQQKWNEITNRYALQNANLSVTYDIANRAYTSAENTINQIAQLKMEAFDPEIQYYSAFLSSNATNLTNAEKEIIQTKKDDLATAQGNIQKNASYAMDLAKTAIANGQADIGAQLYALAQNPDSKFFTQNVANLAGKIRVVQKETPGTITPTTGFFDSKVESSVREDAGALLDNVAIGAITLDGAYSKLRTLYSQAEASDDALKTLLGIVPPLEEVGGVVPQDEQGFVPDSGSGFPVVVQRFMAGIEDLLFGGR